MANQGWIKLHRKLKETSFYKRSVVIHLFLHLLLSVNQQTNKFYWNGEEIEVEAGQIITGRIALSEDTGISVQSIRTALEVLKSTSTITIKVTNKFSLITILKWQDYQGSSTSTSTSNLTNNQPTTNQQLTTNNNDKNEKNDNNTYIERVPPIEKHSSIQSLTSDDLQVIADRYNVPVAFVESKLDDMANWMQAKGKKYKNYRAALCNWVKKDAIKIIQDHKNQPFMRKGGFERL